MIIFPAIDIRGGKCVRLFKGDFARETVFSDRPEEMAAKWEAQGGRFLHLVDLDGALAGKSINLDVVKKIVVTVHIPVELGGGIRTMENIAEVLALGVQRVILGSVAVKNPALVQESCQQYGDRIVVGIDARDGIVAVDGWGVSGDVEAVALAKKMAAAGVRRIIYTDISRDGTLAGVNVEATARLARESGVRVIASGGVSSLDDIRALLPYEKDGIEGVITGKAIYTGSLDLQAAAALAAGTESTKGINSTTGTENVKGIKAGEA